jgi:hypothetical protein
MSNFIDTNKTNDISRLGRLWVEISCDVPELSPGRLFFYDWLVTPDGNLYKQDSSIRQIN